MELALKCFDSADPADAFLQDYVQRQAWRDDAGEGLPLPVGSLPSTRSHRELGSPIPPLRI